MIVYANGKMIATDTEDNAHKVGIAGPEQDELKVTSFEQENLLTSILKELKKINLHFNMINNTFIENEDVEV
jgi:hypothetical protein